MFKVASKYYFNAVIHRISINPEKTWNLNKNHQKPDILDKFVC